MANAVSLLLIPILCVCQLTEFEQGKQLYDSSHYRQACDVFEKLVKNGKRVPALTHYYYANSLLKVGKKAEALESYRTVVALSPRSDIGKFSSQVLEKTKAKKADSSNADVSGLSPDAKSDGQELETADNPTNTVSDVLKHRLANRLPKLVTDFRHGTTIEELESVGAEVGIHTRAYCMEALEHWEAAKANLDTVSKIGIDLIPLHRGHDETSNAFAKRRAEYKRQVDIIVDDYSRNESELRAYYCQQRACYAAYCTKFGKPMDYWLPTVDTKTGADKN